MSVSVPLPPKPYLSFLLPENLAKFKDIMAYLNEYKDTSLDSIVFTLIERGYTRDEISDALKVYIFEKISSLKV